MQFYQLNSSSPVQLFHLESDISSNFNDQGSTQEENLIQLDNRFTKTTCKKRSFQKIYVIQQNFHQNFYSTTQEKTTKKLKLQEQKYIENPVLFSTTTSPSSIKNIDQSYLQQQHKSNNYIGKTQIKNSQLAQKKQLQAQITQRKNKSKKVFPIEEFEDYSSLLTHFFCNKNTQNSSSKNSKQTSIIDLNQSNQLKQHQLHQKQTKKQSLHKIKLSLPESQPEIMAKKHKGLKLNFNQNIQKQQSENQKFKFLSKNVINRLSLRFGNHHYYSVKKNSKIFQKHLNQFQSQQQQQQHQQQQQKQQQQNEQQYQNQFQSQSQDQKSIINSYIKYIDNVSTNQNTFDIEAILKNYKEFSLKDIGLIQKEKERLDQINHLKYLNEKHDLTLRSFEQCQKMNKNINYIDELNDVCNLPKLTQEQLNNFNQQLNTLNAFNRLNRLSIQRYLTFIYSNEIYLNFKNKFSDNYAFYALLILHDKLSNTNKLQSIK